MISRKLSKIDDWDFRFRFQCFVFSAVLISKCALKHTNRLYLSIDPKKFDTYRLIQKKYLSINPKPYVTPTLTPTNRPPVAPTILMLETYRLTKKKFCYAHSYAHKPVAPTIFMLDN